MLTRYSNSSAVQPIPDPAPSGDGRGGQARAAAVEQSATLAKSLRDKEVALQRAEQKIATLEATVGEHKTATIGERTLFEEKIDKLSSKPSLLRVCSQRELCGLLGKSASRAARTATTLHLRTKRSPRRKRPPGRQNPPKVRFCG